MKKFIVANWKANKNLKEALEWIRVFLQGFTPSERIEVIICPPYPLIYPLWLKIKNLPNLRIGAQNVSQHEKGNYTGEVTAYTLASMIDYCIVGHYERRSYFNETNFEIKKKIALLEKYQIEPIYCISNLPSLINININIIAFEPPSAIGSGKNLNLEKILQVKQKIRAKNKNSFYFLYGGSVTPKNVTEYLTPYGKKEIDGFLIGNHSTDPKIFLQILNQIKKKLNL